MQILHQCQYGNRNYRNRHICNKTNKCMGLQHLLQIPPLPLLHTPKIVQLTEPHNEMTTFWFQNKCTGLQQLVKIPPPTHTRTPLLQNVRPCNIWSKSPYALNRRLQGIHDEKHKCFVYLFRFRAPTCFF